VSVEDGRLISLGAERSADWLGGDLSRARYLSEWNEYLSVPWADNHVLKLSGTYGKGSGDRVAQGYFTLGGFANPIAQVTPGIPENLVLRGYPTNFQVGESVVRAEASYRFPLVEFTEGTEGVLPIYTHQLFGEVFYEGGRTWDEGNGGDDLGWLDSTGIEANLSMRLMRYLQFAPGVGAAYIPDRAERSDSDDRFAVYFTFKAWVNF